MIHDKRHPLAGKTAKLRADFHDRSGELRGGLDYRVEDWWDRLGSGSWMNCTGNPACLKYAMRSAFAGVPTDDEVLYGKIGAFGHLVHVSEIETTP